MTRRGLLGLVCFRFMASKEEKKLPYVLQDALLILPAQFVDWKAYNSPSTSLQSKLLHRLAALKGAEWFSKHLSGVEQRFDYMRLSPLKRRMYYLQRITAHAAYIRSHP